MSIIEKLSYLLPIGKAVDTKDEIVIVRKIDVPKLAYRTASKEYTAFLNPLGKYMDVIGIKTKDFESMSRVEVELSKMRWERFYCMYGSDVKMLRLNLPIDVSRNLDFLYHKLKNCKDKHIERGLQDKISELQYLKKRASSKEFFLMYFAENEEDFIQKHRDIYSLLINTGEAMYHPTEKKVRILEKLNNINTSVFW